MMLRPRLVHGFVVTDEFMSGLVNPPTHKVGC